jgi:hypothetical protein
MGRERSGMERWAPGLDRPGVPYPFKLNGLANYKKIWDRALTKSFSRLY